MTTLIYIYIYLFVCQVHITLILLSKTQKDFGLLWKIRTVAKKGLWFLQVLFFVTIFSNAYFMNFEACIQSMKSKMQAISELSQSHDFNITHTKLPITFSPCLNIFLWVRIVYKSAVINTMKLWKRLVIRWVYLFFTTALVPFNHFLETNFFETSNSFKNHKEVLLITVFYVIE